MDNENNWNWNNSDERRVSSVYRDEDETNAFILVNPPQNIDSQNTKTPTAESQPLQQPYASEPQQPIQQLQWTETESQSIGQPQASEPQNIDLQVTELQNTQPQQIEQQAPQLQNTPSQSVEPQIIQQQRIEPQSTNVQDNTRQSGMHSAPQNNIPQSEFHPIVLPQNTYRHQNNNNQNTNHSARFGEHDISENKVSAIAAYLLGPIGIIIALLIARDSAYTAFHVRQALKMTICSVILELFAGFLALFGMIPFVGIIFKMILFLIAAGWVGILILRLIAIAQVSNGEAKEPAIIRNFAFLK